jgi:hypothetical protein
VQQRERGSFKCARNKLDVRSRQYLRAMTKIATENPEFALFQ